MNGRRRSKLWPIFALMALAACQPAPQAGVGVNSAASLSPLIAAAKAGNATAPLEVEGLYQLGRGVAGDYGQAARWYRLAAAQGNAAAKSNLGVVYLKGLGVPKDDLEAVRLFRLAAAQGNAEAQRNLGYIYEQGRGVPQDSAQALHWYRLATAQGLAAAQYTLATLYEHGLGIGQDNVRAAKWLIIAAAGGFPYASHNLALVEGTMTVEQIAEAEARAAKWHSTHHENPFEVPQSIGIPNRAAEPAAS